MLAVEELDHRDLEHARMIANLHRDEVDALVSADLKVAYLSGLFDAQMMLANSRLT